MEMVLFVFYLALPAFAANMAPVIAAKKEWLKKFDFPIDFNKSWNGKRILGDHKTVRGFVVGVTAAMVVSLGQYFLALSGWTDLYFFNWPVDEPRDFLLYVGFGFLGGLGALVGDSVKSFFKRRLGIESGRPFIPFDQIDYLIGFALFTHPLIDWRGMEIIILLLFGIIFNPIINLLAYALKIKKTYW